MLSTPFTSRRPSTDLPLGACLAAPGAGIVPIVSFDIFLQAFRHGDATTADGEAALRLIDPIVVDRGPTWVRVATVDGGADVYGVDSADNALMVNHVSGTAIYGVLYDVAREAGFTLMPVGCAWCIPDSDMRQHLPVEIRDAAVVVGSGDDLRYAIERG